VGVYFAVPAAVAAGALYGVVGALLAVIDPRRRAIWDRLAGTVVVEGDPPSVVVTDLVEPDIAPA
jgi:uncharacterized RDD family membrane protein YckC